MCNLLAQSLCTNLITLEHVVEKWFISLFVRVLSARNLPAPTVDFFAWAFFGNNVKLTVGSFGSNSPFHGNVLTNAALVDLGSAPAAPIVPDLLYLASDTSIRAVRTQIRALKTRDDAFYAARLPGQGGLRP